MANQYAIAFLNTTIPAVFFYTGDEGGRYLSDKPEDAFFGYDTAEDAQAIGDNMVNTMSNMTGMIATTLVKLS